MYLGSDEFNNAIENTQGNAPKIRVTLANGEILSNIKSIKYYGGSNNSDDISIGTTNMARIDVTVLTDKMLTNNEIFLEQGVELANGVVEYMPIGYFVAQKPQGDIDEVKFTACDRMQKFEKPYSSSLTYPTTSALILDELCQICGVELATPIDNAIGVTENLKGYTCREVLGYIASMHSSFACIDRYGKLNLRWYSDTPIEKKLNRIWSFEKSQENFEIAKVEIAKDSETNYVSGDGITTLHNSNPLATQEIADDVFAKLGGFNYSVGEIEMLDDARLDAWDMVSVTYYDGKTYNIPCMTLEHDFKAYSTTVKSVGKSESENEYKFTGPTIQYLNRMATDLLVTNRVVATKVDAEYVKSHAITTDNLDAITAQIQELVVEEIDGKYANIELANIDVANINVGKIAKLFAKVGLIDRATIVEGHITGFLDAVEVNANKITAGTLIADRILLSGGDKGILYALNNLGELTSTNVDSLDGYVLTDRTINADKIIAESITANELDVNQIFGNEAVLNKLVSQQIFSDAISTNTVVVGANTTAKNALDLATSTGLSTGNQILIIDGAESELIDFKAYGRSTQDGTPTPDAPVDIVSVGESGALEIKSTGKNLFDETLRFGRTAVGITTNVNSKKNGVINGTLTQNSSILNWHTTAPIDILGLSVGQSLTISYKRVSGTYTANGTNAKFYCDVCDENKTAISKYQLLVCTLNNSEGSVTFTMTQEMKDNNVSYLYPQIWGYANNNFDNLEMQIQIEHGTNVTEYEPHKSSTVSIPLSAPLRSVGDVRDEIACVDGVYGIIRRIGVSVFDGINNKCNTFGTGGLNHPYGISFTSSNGYNDIDNKAVKIVSGNHRDLISDYFPRDKVVYYADGGTQDLGSGIYRTANGVWLSITRKIADANNITSIEAFNTWLQNNNVTVQYILAEEVFEPFDDQELIRIILYNNTTYITNSDNAEMWVEYYKNNLTGIQLANINGIGQSNNRLLANWASDNDITLIDGAKIYTGSITAKSIDIEDLFAQEITATGTITGATLVSLENNSSKVVIDKGEITIYDFDTRGEGGFYEVGSVFASGGGMVGTSGMWIFDDIETFKGANLDAIHKKVSHPLREYCDCSLFAQAIIDSYVSDVSIYGAQSIAMANINGTDYVLVLFTTSTTANNADVAVLYTLDGQVVRYKTGLKLGHCNGVTFNTKDSQFYVACAGGDNGINQVAVLTSELKIPKTYSLAGKEVQGIYGIAYNKDRETFYVVGSKNSIAEVSTDFSTVLQKSTLQVKNDEYAPQSIFYDGTYISFAYNVDGSSYCDLYEPEDLSFVSMQFINNFGELEGGYYYKDELYLLVNTSNSGLILKSSQYLDGKVFDFWNERHLSDRIQTSDTIHELYFNSTATNFLLDGTLNKPFRKLYYGWSYMVGQSLKNIRMNLIGDFSKYNINIKKYLGTLYITGYNKTTAKIGGIYFRNFGNVRLSYLSVTKQNDSESSLISLYYGQECYMDYVSFDGAGTETYLLRVMGGTCETKHCYFNSNATYSIYANFYAVVTCESSNTYKGTGTMQTYNRAAISLAYRTPMATLVEAYKNEVIIGGSSYGTIDLAKITREGKYRVEGASTVTNCPTVLSTGQFCVDIVRYDYCIEYNVITYRGIPYKGVLGENSTEIKWYSLTAL